MFHTPVPEGEAGAPAADSAIDAEDVILVKDQALGAVLRDGQGHALYVFGADVPGNCNHTPVDRCPGSCAATWPIFSAGSRSLGPGLEDGAFGDFVPTDIAPTQTSFKGWPLYTFFGDLPYESAGEGATAGLWHVARLPFYNIMLMKKKVAGMSSVFYVADGAGYALYRSSADAVGDEANQPSSACDSECAAHWPPFTTDRFVLPSSFEASDFSLFVRADGVLQAAYRGSPLYYSEKDREPGDTFGSGTFQLIDPAL